MCMIKFLRSVYDKQVGQIYELASLCPCFETSSPNILSRRVDNTSNKTFFCKGLFKSCGRGVVIAPNAHIPFHKVEIGNNSGIGPNALLGAVRIGDNVMMGPDVIILSNNKIFDSRLTPMRLQGRTEDNPVVIGDDVWIGARAIILPGVHIGSGAIVGAGEVYPGMYRSTQLW